MNGTTRTELGRERRRLVAHTIAFVTSLVVAAAATFAVHYEASTGLPDGLAGTALGALEVVFIAGIIPLTVTAIYSLIALVGALLTQRRRQRVVPSARLRAR